MNHIKASVTSIQHSDKLTLVSFAANGAELSMISLDLNTAIQKNSKVVLGVKSTSIALAKNLSGEISMSNQLPCIVESFNLGALLCSITLAFGDAQIQSIITRSSLLKMHIEVGDEVIALIKASELSLLEVLS